MNIGQASNSQRERAYRLSLWAAYGVGVGICWTTEVIFWGHQAYASLLAFCLLVVEESVRSFEHTLLQHIETYPPASGGLSVLLAAIAVGAAFPLVYLLSRSRKRFVRRVGIFLIFALAFMTLYWVRVPSSFF